MPKSQQRPRRSRPAEEARRQSQKDVIQRQEEREFIISLLQRLPDDDIPRWTQPGDLELPPEASRELVAATADVYLVQIGIFEQMFAQAMDNPDGPQPDTLLGYLGCVKVNMDDVQEILAEIQDLSEPPLVGIVRQFEGAIRNFSTAYDSYAALTTEDSDETDETDETEDFPPQEVQIAQLEARLRVNAEGMRHCAWKSANPESPAQKEAYQRLLFQLYHWNRLLTPQELDSEEQDPREPGLNAAMRQALDQCEEIRNQQLEKFHRENPTMLGPVFDQATEEVRNMAEEIPVEPVGFAFGVLIDPEIRPHPDHPDGVRMYHSYVAYHHEGKRNVHGLGDPYPPGYPRELAYVQMKRIAEEIRHPDPKLQNGAMYTAFIASNMALAGAHCVTRQGMQDLVAQSRLLQMTDGAITQAVAEALYHNELILGELMEQGGIPEPFIAKEQAQAVVDAGRKAGLDAHQLAAICEAMMWDEEELKVHRPVPKTRTARNLLKAAEKAGFDPEAVDQMAHFLQGQ